MGNGSSPTVTPRQSPSASIARSTHSIRLSRLTSTNSFRSRRGNDGLQPPSQERCCRGAWSAPLAPSTNLLSAGKRNSRTSWKNWKVFRPHNAPDGSPRCRDVFRMQSRKKMIWMMRSVTSSWTNTPLPWSSINCGLRLRRSRNSSSKRAESGRTQMIPSWAHWKSALARRNFLT